ncbi:hypothetical protein HWV62_28747, partial [Athelia sp. TMB]
LDDSASFCLSFYTLYIDFTLSYIILATMSSLSGLPTHPQLTESNYPEWAANTKALLQSHKLWRLVSGVQTKPTAASGTTKLSPDPVEEWEDRSERACGILALSISPGQKPHITSCSDDPVKIWIALKDVHEAKQPGNRFNAYSDLFSIRKEPDESLSSLIMRSEHCMQLIKNLRTSTFTLESLDDELQCMALIRALPDEFDHFASTLIITNKLDKSSLISAFHTEEVQCSRKAIETANVAKASKTSSCSGRKTWYCTFHKNDVAHSSDRCFLNPDYTGPRPPWFKSPSASVQQAHQASTHAPAAPQSPTDHAYVVSTSLPSSRHLKTHCWNTDTGATSHMTMHRPWLSNFRPYWFQ